MSSSATEDKQNSSSSSSMVELLGPSLMVDTNTKKSTVELLQNKSLILLYFSAHWCPPCRAFTPKLREFYKQAIKNDKNSLEIIYVSSDRSLPEFQDYYGKMPWLAIPTDDAAAAQVKNRLAAQLKIQGIPALIVLKKDDGSAAFSLLFVTNQARDQVQLAYSSPQALLDEWKNKQPAVPLEEANLGGGGGEATLGKVLIQIILTVLKNPIYMFGLLYFINYYLRKKYRGGEETTLLQDSTTENAQQEESEF